jgi:hypothetical protein
VDGLIERARRDARARAPLATAYRVRLARLANGVDEEESAEAEAGAILDAETAVETHEIHGMIEAYFEALKNASG